MVRIPFCCLSKSCRKLGATYGFVFEKDAWTFPCNWSLDIWSPGPRNVNWTRCRPSMLLLSFLASSIPLLFCFRFQYRWSAAVNGRYLYRTCRFTNQFNMPLAQVAGATDSPARIQRSVSLRHCSIMIGKRVTAPIGPRSPCLSDYNIAFRADRWPRGLL